MSKQPLSITLAKQLDVLSGRGFKLETLYDVGANEQGSVFAIFYSALLW